MSQHSMDIAKLHSGPFALNVTDKDLPSGERGAGWILRIFPELHVCCSIPVNAIANSENGPNAILLQPAVK